MHEKRVVLRKVSDKMGTPKSSQTGRIFPDKIAFDTKALLEVKRDWSSVGKREFRAS